MGCRWSRVRISPPRPFFQLLPLVFANGLQNTGQIYKTPAQPLRGYDSFAPQSGLLRSLLRMTSLRPMKDVPYANVTPSTHSRMQAVRRRDTSPEILVRRALHGLGYRFRLYRQ